MSGAVDFYSGQYGGFFRPPYTAVRSETFDEDIRQDSWLTADELREQLRLLDVTYVAVRNGNREQRKQRYATW